MAVQGISGMAVAATVGGWILLYSGLRGAKVSDTLRSLVSGQKPTGTQVNPVTADFSTGASGSSPDASSAPVTTGTGQGGTPAKNKALGKMLASTYGWHVDPYWSALVRLWDSESGWRNDIWNTSASCGGDAYAFGIVQACGHGVHKSIPGHGSVCPYPAGNPGNPPQCGGSNDAAAQITWGLVYIKQRYGDPTRVPLGGY